jgi:hypothetical protein
MNRRDLLAEGWRYLAQALPVMVATAGSLGVLLRHSPETAIDQGAACFPARTGEMVPPTSTPLPEEA